MSVVRSPSALCTNRDRGETGSRTSQIWLLSSTFFISAPSTLPISQEYGIISPTCCSFHVLVGQGSKHRKFV